MIKRASIMWISFLSLNGICHAQEIPATMVSCKTAYPDQPKGHAIDIYEFFGKSSDSRCIVTNLGAALNSKQI